MIESINMHYDAPRGLGTWEGRDMLDMKMGSSRYLIQYGPIYGTVGSQ